MPSVRSGGSRSTTVGPARFSLPAGRPATALAAAERPFDPDGWTLPTGFAAAAAVVVSAGAGAAASIGRSWDRDDRMSSRDSSGLVTHTISLLSAPFRFDAGGDTRFAGAAASGAISTI